MPSIRPSTKHLTGRPHSLHLLARTIVRTPADPGSRWLLNITKLEPNHDSNILTRGCVLCASWISKTSTVLRSCLASPICGLGSVAAPRRLRAFQVAMRISGGGAAEVGGLREGRSMCQHTDSIGNPQLTLTSLDLSSQNPPLDIKQGLSVRIVS